MTGNIVLIGFMGVGKGVTARELARKTTLYPVDCDDLIESMVNLKIRKLFSLYGEEEFRRLEQKTALWLEHHVGQAIISTGGGFVNVPNLKSIGTVVHLHADFDYIIERIQKHPNADKKIKKRPLLQDMDGARQLYMKRLPLYSKAADHAVDVTAKKPDIIAAEICKVCQLEMVD